jgi:hypothetical protein
VTDVGERIYRQFCENHETNVSLVGGMTEYGAYHVVSLNSREIIRSCWVDLLFGNGAHESSRSIDFPVRVSYRHEYCQEYGCGDGCGYQGCEY